MKELIGVVLQVVPGGERLASRLGIKLDTQRRGAVPASVGEEILIEETEDD